MFRTVRGWRRRTFSAVQTAWRRGRHSNPQYRSETCKRRRLRKLHGINQFRNSLRLPAPHSDTLKQCGFRELTTLYSFCADGTCTDGAAPVAPLVEATDGDFYGTASFYGA